MTKKCPVPVELDPARMTLLTGFFETYLILDDVEERKLEEDWIEKTKGMGATELGCDT